VLNELIEESEKDVFIIEDHFEDVHSKVEAVLTERIGETGKKIHTGRSRNDQVMVDLCLYFKEEIFSLKDLVKGLFDILIILGDKHKNDLMPGYTHMQIAMPSSFGLWFGAHAEMLVDDVFLLEAAHRIADQNPLGSAAGYGSSFPLDRNMTTKELGFKDLKINSIAAQLSRGKVEKSLAFAMSSIASTVSKLAMDICTYMGQNYGFFKFPDNLTTGSSIMPHKKNPDVWELVRAKCNRIQSLPTELAMILNNLTTGYHRDFQVIKESVFPQIETLKSCLEIATYMLEHIEINTDVLDNPLYDNIFTVETVNRLIIEEGLSFRDAYKRVGEMLEKGEYKPHKELKHTHIGSIGNPENQLIIKKMERAMDW
jgi:argininosuccinate lyase